MRLAAEALDLVLQSQFLELQAHQGRFIWPGALVFAGNARFQAGMAFLEGFETRHQAHGNSFEFHPIAARAGGEATATSNCNAVRARISSGIRRWVGGDPGGLNPRSGTTARGHDMTRKC